MKDLVLYDGSCGLCHGAVKFLIARDQDRKLRYAALQSPMAVERLEKHNKSAADLDTIYVLADFDTEQERVLDRGQAALHLGRRLPGPYPFLVALVGWLPKPVLDWGYNQVAKRRYKIFGRADVCSIPTPEERALFLDIVVES